ncbi:hypothetical protein IW143_000557 [Coemansia sp. RSA 520]|nr:hypothetical protein IW142_000691 [Coemansia sp. RSA 564]KAJ2199726.1 hypothetical protein GGH18_000350 [Coemansia sp. RSA 530]KAJ2209027.1 hypothetical protein IW145_000293 [Coemansia sp. RSA 521]KAJ2224422.1 hypothetical protein IW143_000557 [Coemansia sp. RSA 520]KAJ2435572.1 hypothetical protein IWW41_000796 [Coemansia sp. RSA 2522]
MSISTKTEHAFAQTESSKPPSTVHSTNLLGQPRWAVGKTLVVFIGLSLVMFMVCVSETVFNQVLAPIKSEFNTEIFAQWIEAGFLLTCVMVQPVWVKLADKYGRAWPLFASIFVFLGFSCMVGGAKSMSALCVGRALQGVGGAGMMPLALVVLTDVLTPNERPVYMGGLGAVIVLGKWTGPAIGSMIVEKGSWRWAGYMNLPIGSVALLLLVPYMRRLPMPPGSTAYTMREFDYLGTLLWLGGSLMILLGLSWGGNEHTWHSSLVICMFVCGFLAILVFAAVEHWQAKWPLIPLFVLARPRTLLALVASLFIGVCMYGMIMFVPVYYTMVLAQSARESALHILWFTLGGCTGAILAGSLVNMRRVWYREWAVVGTAMMAVGFGLMFVWPEDPAQTVRHAGIQVLLGLGLGFSMQQVLLASQAGLPVTEVSTVTTLVDYARTLGGMIGLVIGQVILKEKLFATINREFGVFSPVRGEGHDVVSLTSMVPMMSLLPESVAKDVYNGVVDALHYVFIADVPFAVMACILCVFLSNIPLHAVSPNRKDSETTVDLIQS